MAKASALRRSPLARAATARQPGLRRQGPARPAARPPQDMPADIDVFGLAALGMVITDLNGRFRRVNPEFARLVGRSQPELLGMSFNALTSPDDIDLGNAAMAGLLARPHETVAFDKRYLRPDGSVVWVEINIRCLTTAAGEVYAFLAQAVDITNRRRAEIATEVERHRLEEAQHVAGLGSFEQEPATGVVYPSSELCRILGFLPRKPLTSRRSWDACTPTTGRPSGRAMRKGFEHAAPVDLVHRLLSGDGTVRWVHTRAVTIVGEDGRGQGAGHDARHNQPRRRPRTRWSSTRSTTR